MNEKDMIQIGDFLTFNPTALKAAITAKSSEIQQ